MRFFWPIYFVSVAAGSAGVYFAAPMARPLVERLLGPAPSAEERQGNAGQAALVLRTTPSQQPARPKATPAGTPTDAGQHVDVADGVEDLPPALNGIYLVQRGETPGWGVTHQRTMTYALDGTRKGYVPAGSVFEYRGVRKSSKGAMAECAVVENGVPASPVLLSSQDARMFTGSYTKLSAKQLADLQAYYTLSGKIAARKIELLQEAGAKNPFFAEYQAAHKKLTDHIDKAKALTVQRDKATELDRIRISDQLREMKNEEGRLRAAYDAIHQKFREWKAQHANELERPENDPNVQQWTQQMSELRPRVPGLAY